MKNKVITALLSLVAAFSLWLYVITVVSPDSENTFYDIPVAVKNEAILWERGLMVRPDQTPTVTLRLSGNRSDLIKLNSDNIMVEVDGSKILQTGTAQLNYTITYPGNVPNNAVTVESRNPDYIELEVWEYAEKTVPVKANYVGEREEGYMVEDVTFSLVEVRVAGKKDVVNQVHSAQVDIDLSHVTQSFSKTMEFTLRDQNGNAIDDKFILLPDGQDNGKQVDVQLTMSHVKEVPVVIKELIAGGGATKDHCQVVYSHSSIRISGSEADLAKLDKIELEAIPLESINETGIGIFEREIVLPAGVKNETGVDTVTVTVTVQNLETKQLSVTNIQPINHGEQQMDMYTEVVPVTVRGPEDLIGQIQASDITAVVDFAGLGQGTHKIAVRFEFTEAYSQVGVIGTVHVSARLGAKSAQ